MTVTRNRVAWLAGGGVPSVATTSTLTMTSGRIPASSDASSALSTASLTQVRSALRGLSNPSRCRFLVKNSETEISRCRAPISTADTVGAGFAVAGLARTVAITSLISDPWPGAAVNSQRDAGSGELLTLGSTLHHVGEGPEQLVAVAVPGAAVHARQRRRLQVREPLEVLSSIARVRVVVQRPTEGFARLQD